MGHLAMRIATDRDGEYRPRPRTVHRTRIRRASAVRRPARHRTAPRACARRRRAAAAVRRCGHLASSCASLSEEINAPSARASGSLSAKPSSTANRRSADGLSGACTAQRLVAMVRRNPADAAVGPARPRPNAQGPRYRSSHSVNPANTRPSISEWGIGSKAQLRSSGSRLKASSAERGNPVIGNRTNALRARRPPASRLRQERCKVPRRLDCRKRA